MKNKISHIVWISILLFSCSGGGDSTSIPEPQNTAPTIPDLVSPTNSKLCISNFVIFEWGTSTDTEKNPIVYQLQVATDNQFTQITNTTDISNPNQTLSLEKGKAYYWRVKATDSKNASSNYSSTNSFYTEGVSLSNHLPFLPQLLSPDNNSTLSTSTTKLTWTATDVDATDVLTYDVYLGTESSPTLKVGSSISVASFVTNSFISNTIYYWKVVAKDNKGGETIGQVWKFKSN